MGKSGETKCGSCVYCGALGEVSRDHVIPLTLFTRPYPPNLITVPCCLVCNNGKSRDDDYLRDMLVCDLFAEQSPTAKQVLEQRTLRSAARGKSVLARDTRASGAITPLYSNGGVYFGSYP